MRTLFAVTLGCAGALAAHPLVAVDPEAGDAPVLRVARDRPALEAIGPPPVSARRSGAANLPPSTLPKKAADAEQEKGPAPDTPSTSGSQLPRLASPAMAAATAWAAQDGWVAREMVRKILPLLDPPSQSAPSQSAADAAPGEEPSEGEALPGGNALEARSAELSLAPPTDPAARSAEFTPAAPPAEDAAADVQPSSSRRRAIVLESAQSKEAQGRPAEEFDVPAAEDFAPAEDFAGAKETEEVAESTGEALPVRRPRIASDGSPIDPHALRRPAPNPRRPADPDDNEGPVAAAPPDGDDEGVMPESTGGADLESAERLESVERGARRTSEVPERSAAPSSRVPEVDLAQPAPAIRAEALRLKAPIEQLLRHHFLRPEDARQRSPWGMLHAILPYEGDTQIIHAGRRYNAVAWLAGNNPSRNQRLLTARRGSLEALSGVGLQGHQGQMLAILAQVGVPSDYPLHAGQGVFTVRDLVQSEAAICRDGQELTFTLIGMVHYLDTDTRWQSRDGQRWDFERLIREELKQPVIGAACGGTHRLMALSHAVQRRHEEGKEISGQWNRAEIFIHDFIEYAWQLQNPDGSMSTQWFEGRADSGDVDRKVRTTGHILEWLVYATPEDQLQEERMVRCVRFLVQAMLQNRDHAWDVGPKGHALRALAQYHRRVFTDSPSPWQGSATAGRAPRQTPSARR